MDKETADKLFKEARRALKMNDRGGWTVPAPHLYPHQWFWDSCFVSIGLRHLSVERAQTELVSLIRGQWSNGMIPCIVFAKGRQYRQEHNLWRSWVSPYAPPDVVTSGITQPPMLAEAIVRVGKKLKNPERRSWYRLMYPPLLRYHEWLYAERNPHKENLIILLHPWETGLDNTPPWISELRKHSVPWWLLAVERAHIDRIINLVRRDTRHVPPGQRMSNIEAIAYWNALRRLRRKAYNSEALLSRSLFAVEDLAFNCILVRANFYLKHISSEINWAVPPALAEAMYQTEGALEQLWDESSGQYYSRSFVSHKLIEEPTIATLLPLYAGCIKQDRAQHLVDLLKRRNLFKTSWPVPSVPVNSSYFDPFKYWQGPTWINTNWLIIDGLRRYGFKEEASHLRQSTLDLVTDSGMNEYFNPLTGEPAGAANFSWTAALTIDLLKAQS